MKDDLIDCSGFEDSGIPTPIECWRQQAHMLTCELGDLQRDLSDALRSIHKLVGMHSEAAKQRDALALEVTRLGWELGDSIRESDRTTGR
jgi:hypothetical protein